MPNTIAIAQVHRVTPKYAHVGVVPVSVLSTETYSAAGGGFTIDFSSFLTQLAINFADVVAIIGDTATGHQVQGTKSATTGQFTVRLWNGTAQIVDGAMNQTLNLLLLYSQGAVT
jgi:hypothetical protein